MCFSATASFTAGAALSAIGGATIAKAKKRSEKLFAAIPLIFGIQQFIEGGVWLSVGNYKLMTTLSYAFLFLSHVFWPTWMPLAVYYIEPSPVRRKFLCLFLGLGIMISLYFLYFLFTEPFTTTVLHDSIGYVAPHFAKTYVFSPYAFATCISCLASSHRYINVFGVAIFLSSFAADYWYAHTFASVWCYFAAILSAIIYLHFHFEYRETSKRRD